MTYCIGMKTDKGLLFMSDTRTNAGLDNVSTFKKMFSWCENDLAFITLLSAGNLATTQSLVSILDGQSGKKKKGVLPILSQTSMFDTAQLVGRTLKEVIESNKGTGQVADSSFHASVILGGQVKNDVPRIFLIYPEGNFIEVSSDNPFFQVGETKYGKPILLRAFDSQMNFSDGLKLMLLSFDSTIKANISVGPPIDFQIYLSDSFNFGPNGRFYKDDPYLSEISNGWSRALKVAFDSMPNLSINIEKS